MCFTLKKMTIGLYVCTKPQENSIYLRKCSFARNTSPAHYYTFLYRIERGHLAFSRKNMLNYI